MFKNIEHLRTASNRSTTPSKNNLSPISEGSSTQGAGPSLTVPQVFRSLVGGKLPPQEHFPVEQEVTRSISVPAIQLPSTIHSSSPRYSPTEHSMESGHLQRHSTPPLTNTVHNLVVNQDSGPLPSGWQLNPNGTVAIRPSLDNSVSPRRRTSIASTSYSSTMIGTGVDIPVQPLGKYRARRATIEVETDSEGEDLTSRRRRHTPQQRSMASTSSSDGPKARPSLPRGQRTRNSGTSPAFATTTTTNFPVYQRHQTQRPPQKNQKQGDTLV